MNYVISIIKPEALSVLEEICNEIEVPVSETFYGLGTAVQSMIDLLGIESNERRVIFSVVTQKKTKAFINEQKRRLHIGVPGHGIILAIPIKSIGGGRTVAYLTGEEDKTKYTPQSTYAYELIVVITCEGYTDLVMNAARNAGARGGTVLHAKGTGAKGEQKFHNISLAEEKEVILILSGSEHKSAIMREILTKAGPGSKAHSMVFSLPVSETAGFGLL